MPLHDTGTAPYAPTHAVTRALDAYRDNGLAVTPANLVRLGVPETITGRTIQALKILDLLNEDGSPSQALVDFKQAPSGTYKEKLAETLRAAYAPIFAVTGADINGKTPTDIEDAFRLYTPDSLRPRMVNLFLGLCEYVGLIESAPARKSGPKSGRTAKKAGPAPKPKKDEGTPADPPAAPPRQKGANILEFRSGGTLTLSYSVDLWDLSSEDREFLFGLIDKVKSYPAQRQLPAAGGTTQTVGTS